MKKRILIVLSVVICICAITVFIIAGKGISPSTGYYLETEKSHMVILDNSPVVMSNLPGNDDIFEKYQNGDRILILHDGIRESYPGGTGVYFIIKVADGSKDEIPSTVIEQLTELGWIE